MIQQTLVLIKPDGLKKSLTGNVLTRLSETRLDIIAAKIVSVRRELAEEHYRHLKDKSFFEDLIKYKPILRRQMLFLFAGLTAE
ncbi:MAG: hypothetical protein B5M48_02095 [Candidatus Omnitrophica bacterium 4484_213]|nr:MAG: hypothetical protein B5M48_02095 [Candidatus Omnitrophica bacterium 4484_213]